MTSDSMKKPAWLKRLAPIDYLALVGGVINAIVISAIVIYWLLS